MILLSSIIQRFEAELLAQYHNALLPSHFKALVAMGDRIQFQPGMSLFEFFGQRGSEAQCEAALERAR